MSLAGVASIIPETVVGAFEKGEVLPVWLIWLLFGFALNSVPDVGRPVLALIDGIAQTLFGILAMIMRLPAWCVRSDGIYCGPFRYPRGWRNDERTVVDRRADARLAAKRRRIASYVVARRLSGMQNFAS